MNIFGTWKPTRILPETLSFAEVEALMQGIEKRQQIRTGRKPETLEERRKRFIRIQQRRYLDTARKRATPD